MGHPDVCVTEEKPMLDSVARSIGGYERIAELDESELDTLRNLYFAQAAQYVPDLGNRILIDKQPFAMVEAPLIHRLFPAAKFLFVLRHPCDVVLSCFVTRFEPIGGLVNFTTLEGTAQLYDQMFRFWGQCRTILPMIVQRVRYERLVEDAEPEMRALAAFMAPAGRGQDGVERRLLRAAPRAVAFDDLDIVVAKPAHPLARDLDQPMLPFDGDDPVGNAADDRRGISRACTDLEHYVVRSDRRGLDHQGDDVWLADRLLGLDR